jgi:plasmid stabilization system protein ParE
MRYEFHPEALIDYEEAARYYAECQPGLELRFVACIESTIERVLAAPNRWRIIEDDVRRCLVRVFPYAVIYSIEPEFVLIIAVMHCHREPGCWHSRLREGNEQ